MNRLPFGIGDFVTSFKGDSPGHPFRGNQYDEGGGEHGYIDKVHEVSSRNGIGVQRDEFDKSMPQSSRENLIKRSLIGASKDDLRAVASEIDKSETLLRKLDSDLQGKLQTELNKPSRNTAEVGRLEGELNKLSGEYRQIKHYRSVVGDLIDFS